MSALHVRQPGLLSLLQDRGRFGQAALGLTTGGPMDPVASALANQLLQNPRESTVLEVSFGGLEVQAEGNVQLAICGATVPISIDNRERPGWTVLDLSDGEILTLGFSEAGCRTYLAVRGGFCVPPIFGSSATVIRESIGGLNGKKLAANDYLPVGAAEAVEHAWLSPRHRPTYHQRATLRVIPGYQESSFSRLEQRRFYSSEYAISAKSDRMGYRMNGPALSCDLTGILSEGIALGAIQIPADGQPIALLNDRQTIGGYPKIGTILSLDCASLAQLRPGDLVNFTPISPQAAHNALHLAQAFETSRHIEPSPV